MATKGSKLDNMEAFEASTCLMLLFQIKLAIPCTTTAVPIRKDQSDILELICMGVSSKKAKGIDTIKPTTFEYKVIVSGSILLRKKPRHDNHNGECYHRYNNP